MPQAERSEGTSWSGKELVVLLAADEMPTTQTTV